MRKYWMIVQLAWSSGLVYRTSLILWRFRQLLSTLMALTLWSVIFQNEASAFGYSREQMLSYILVVSILQTIILATTNHNLAGEIYSGRISMMLLKPQQIFLTLAANDLADKARNFIFGALEAVILFAVFKPELIWPGVGLGLLFIAWAVLGAVLNFFLTVLFGTIGFWSPDAWGPKFVFFMIVDFTAGKLFPLDILPLAVQRFLTFTPFPYLSYAQTQLFLGRYGMAQAVQGSLVLMGWVAITWLATKLIWQRGLRQYEAMGQ